MCNIILNTKCFKDTIKRDRPNNGRHKTIVLGDSKVENSNGWQLKYNVITDLTLSAMCREEMITFVDQQIIKVDGQLHRGYLPSKQ